MPKYKLEQPQSPERRAARVEPAGLEEFTAEAAVTPPPELVERKGQGRVLPENPTTVRFPPEVMEALKRLAKHDRRSKQQILELVAFPAILAAAERIAAH